MHGPLAISSSINDCGPVHADASETKKTCERARKSSGSSYHALLSCYKSMKTLSVWYSYRFFIFMPLRCYHLKHYSLGVLIRQFLVAREFIITHDDVICSVQLCFFFFQVIFYFLVIRLPIPFMPKKINHMLAFSKTSLRTGHRYFPPQFCLCCSLSWKYILILEILTCSSALTFYVAHKSLLVSFEQLRPPLPMMCK